MKTLGSDGVSCAYRPINFYYVISYSTFVDYRNTFLGIVLVWQSHWKILLYFMPLAPLLRAFFIIVLLQKEYAQSIVIINWLFSYL